MKRVMMAMTAGVVALCAGGAAAGTSVWVDSPATPLSAAGNGGAGSEIVLQGVRGQVVCAQIGLRNSEPDSTPITLGGTDLAGPGGAVISKASFTLYREAAGPGAVAFDALVPLELPGVGNVANGLPLDGTQAAAFWVDLLIPSDAKPGDYTGAVTVTRGDKSKRIPVALHVYDFTLPEDSTLPVFFYAGDCHNGPATKHQEDYPTAYGAEIARHRVSYTRTDWFFCLGSGGDAQAKFNLQEYMNATKRVFSCHYFWWDCGPNPDRTARWVAAAKAAGSEDRLYMAFSHLRRGHEGQSKDDAKRAELGIKLAPQVARHIITNDPMDDQHTIWKLANNNVVPLNEYWSGVAPRRDWKNFRDDGHALWIQLRLAENKPYPSLGGNVDPRVYGWLAWEEEVAGYICYDDFSGTKWTGQLVYSGDFTAFSGGPAWALVKDIRMPVISRRLKLLRQGLQEYELLKLAETRTSYDKVEAIVKGVYTDPTRWSASEAAWDKAAEGILRLLTGK